MFSGQAQLSGSAVAGQADGTGELLPEYPADVADADAALVADSLVSSCGGRRTAVSYPPRT